MDQHTINEAAKELARFVFGTLFLAALVTFIVLAVTATPGDVKEVEADDV